MGERVLPSVPSLVKYNVPEIISLKKKGEPSRSKKQTNKETEEALDCILPPREWTEDGFLWRQKVSSEPVTRSEVIKLGELLDLRLQESHAKMLGICPVRREIFTQCFDELVRQITLNCVEQGVLLLRVRDEMRMTCRTYQALYESAIAFGLRKCMQTENDGDVKSEQIEKLKEENSQLRDEVDGLQQRVKQMDRRNTEVRIAEQKKYEDQLQFLKRTNQQLKIKMLRSFVCRMMGKQEARVPLVHQVQLEGIINPKK